MKKAAIFLLIFCMFCCLFTGCGAEKKVSKSGFYFDTIITITLYGTNDESYINDCFSLAGEYEDKFSNTVEDSEISEINAAGGEYVTVSDETIELLNYGIEYGNVSDGLFDLTIGGVSDLWDFSDIAENLESEDNEADASVIPSDSKIKAALSHVDYKNIDISGNKVRLLDPDSRIDVGGIAKGYIADKMREFLNEKGITTGVISLGGNVLTLGEKADDEVYTIGIQKPFAETGTALATIKLKDASVVSSGIYERYYRVDGEIYHHILDTGTGYPVENDLWQVTVISTRSMDGDALSTTCFALGLSDGMELIENTDGIEAIFVTDDGELHLSSGISLGDDEEASLFLKSDVVE
jgi:thiamine biosynthesis lipoprotein